MFRQLSSDVVLFRREGWSRHHAREPIEVEGGTTCTLSSATSGFHIRQALPCCGKAILSAISLPSIGAGPGP